MGAITFEELAKVNVNPHCDKKGGLTYLSWAWAVDYMIRMDPEATWEYREWDGKPFLTLPDGSCMVYCTVTFGGKKRTCHLPVMDYKNKAILNPDAFQVNTTMQRCLVKAIALHGLGLYIYAGEDLPKEEADAKGNDSGQKVVEQIKNANVTPNADAGKDLTPDQRERVSKIASEIVDCFEAGAPDAALEVYEEGKMSNEEKLFLWTFLPANQRSALKKMGKAKLDAKIKDLEGTQA